MRPGFAQISAKARGPLTYVVGKPGQMGITFSVTGDGHFLGGTSRLRRSLVDRMISGDALVTTPHKAFGAFGERAAGGIGIINPKALSLPLFTWIERDSRVTPAERKLIVTAILLTYSQVKQQ